MQKSRKHLQAGSNSAAITTIIVNSSKSIIDTLCERSREIREFFSITPEFKEKVSHMINSFPNLPNTFEDMVLYYIKTLEYFELYALDPYDPRLERVEQKLEFLGQKLGLHGEISKNVKLKAQQILAYN